MRLVLVTTLILTFGPTAASLRASPFWSQTAAIPSPQRFVVLAAGMDGKGDQDESNTPEDDSKILGVLDPEMARLLFAGIAGAFVTILATAVYRRYDKNAARTKITLDFYSQFNSLEFYTNIRAKAYSFFIRHLLRDEGLRAAIGYANFPPHYTMPEEFGTGSSHASKMLSPSWTDKPVSDLMGLNSAIPKDISTSILMDFFHNLVQCADKGIADEDLTRDLFNQQWFLFRDYYLYLAREIIMTPEFRSEKGVVYPGYREAKAILDRQGIDDVLIIKQIKEVLSFFHEPGARFWKSSHRDSHALFATEIERAAREIDERVEAYRREAFDHPERLSDCLVSLVSPNQLAKDSRCVTLRADGFVNPRQPGDSGRDGAGKAEETSIALITPE